ncbi:putative mucin TcMUCII [Trypanosoma cruzi]|uniref:Mucin TcMUCII, putative n=2 Tax=Trypanosoma cruzi TaxID=5693 RepID=Q4D0A6_TRYCC|nr:mucin TcMUCII, putative [Trypanosoma cruzi]EAN85954.1 mucin TcMUCII, putative [Trypanosoma cruzi]PWV20987.1 putative mucin TcMUCII [Trypanosoma cruzi]RNC40855.1 mucin TcMUCII [Trypanosoma cruzi]|eukprot:XP_807805.1 mucin TcMUCII [Trypanosoma cruzi strain CL Brener]
MMMTCRLLCALLVLALCCCCPSMYASEIPKKPNVDLDGSHSSPSGTGVQEALQATSQSGPQVLMSVPDQDKVDGEKRVLTDRNPQAGDAHNPVNGEVADGDTGLQILSDVSAEQTHEEPESRAKKTTTATKTKSPEDDKKSKPEANPNATSPIPSAPVTKPSDASAEKNTTTTTTTTTTTHPPITTTTEAPAVSTTRAPSRLREIDGSLSSSAWVCAPLVLAASALAYTTLG